MARERQAWHRRRRNVPMWPVLVLAVLVLGMWGFADLRPGGPGGAPSPRPTAVEVVYRTIRLFALEFDLPPGTTAPWQLWVAAFAAPVLTLRGIARLFREQLSTVLTHYLVRPRMVVFGANERSAALLAAAERPGRWRDALVVVDPDPTALRSVAAPRVWTVRGHGSSAAALRQAAVSRARAVVVVTGDNARNSAITTAVLDLEPPPALDLYVEVEEPGLARTVEQGGYRAGVETVPFNASALAAAAVLDELDDHHRSTGRQPLLAPGPGGAGPSLALFGAGPLVDAVVLELHHRRQVQLLDDPGSVAVRPRVVLFGPDAGRRRHALANLVGTELHLLDLDALDIELDQVVELDVDTARHLARNGPLRQVFVLAPSDLDGGGIAITLARHLGPGSTVVLVTGSASTPFGDEIEKQSRVSATVGEVRLRRVPQLAYRLPVLQAERLADRLGRALHAVDAAAGEPWSRLTPAEQAGYRGRAEERLAAAAVPLRRSAIVAPAPAETPLLEALGFDQPTALARSGLRIDFLSVASLLPPARRLLIDGHEAAFAAWCEVARLHSDPDALAGDTPAAAAGPAAADVRELMAVRRRHLEDPAGAGGRTDRRTILLLCGPTDRSEDAVELLAPTLRHLPDDTDAWAVGPAGPLRAELVRLGARAADGPPRRQALRIWRTLAATGDADGRVRVLALPGAAVDDIMLARALCRMLGRVETPDAADLSRALLNGAAGVVPLPPDRMTVRAFLRPSRWPADLAALHEPIAAELHRRYVARQRARKAPDDPALKSWSALSPWLRRSNLAVVDDVPTKLAAIGLRLSGTGGSAPDPELARRLTDEIELLAELEHGRYTAERLLSGWSDGVRDPVRFLSPHLEPWSALDEEAREWDREVVRDLPAVLAAYGVRVRPLGS